VTNKTTALFGGYGALLVGARRSPAHYCTCVVACVTDSGIRERGSYTRISSRLYVSSVVKYVAAYVRALLFVGLLACCIYSAGLI
jgi:hypothetical protein